MLRKMYLVSPDYVDKKPPLPPTQSYTQLPQPKVAKRKKQNNKKIKHGRVKKKQHPYDKWVKMRHAMQEADISRKALIQKIADFLQKVLPNNTYVGKAPPETLDVSAGPISEAPDLNVGPISGTPDTSLPFMPRAHESVYGTPVKRTLLMDSDEEEEGAVPGETTVREYSTTNLGPVVSPYISSYVFRKGNLDRDFEIRRDVDGQFRIGKALIDIDKNSNVFVQGKAYEGTKGLFELLTRKKDDHSVITDKDLKSYREILEATHGHLENNDPSGIIKTTRGPKFKEVISKLFPGGVKMRGAECTSRQKWDPY